MTVTPKIKIIAIGGKACNIIRRLNVSLKENKNVECVAIARPGKIFNQVGVAQKIELRTEKDLDLLDEEVQEKIVSSNIDEKKDEITKALSGADILFVLGNLSSKVNTLQIEKILSLVKNKDIPTIFFGSTPFVFEGEKLAVVAAEARAYMTQIVDATLIIDNNKLLAQNIAASEALSQVDTIIENSVTALVDIVANFGVINVDFNDFKTTIVRAGEAFFNTAIGSEDNLPELYNNLFANTYLDTKFDGMKKVIYVIKSGADLSLDSVEKIGEAICQRAAQDSRIIFGVATDAGMKGTVRVTLIGGMRG